MCEVSILPHIQVLICWKCNQCLKCHKSLGSSLSLWSGHGRVSGAALRISKVKVPSVTQRQGHLMSYFGQLKTKCLMWLLHGLGKRL